MVISGYVLSITRPYFYACLHFTCLFFSKFVVFVLTSSLKVVLFYFIYFDSQLAFNYSTWHLFLRKNFIQEKIKMKIRKIWWIIFLSTAIKTLDLSICGFRLLFCRLVSHSISLCFAIVVKFCFTSVFKLSPCLS